MSVPAKEKLDELPPYDTVAEGARLLSSWQQPAWRSAGKVRRSRALRFFVLACIVFIAYAQWRQMPSFRLRPNASTSQTLNAHSLSLARLQEDLKTCAKLNHKPRDAVGAGRSKSARYMDGHKPTLIRNALVWTGEPTPGHSYSDAELRAGKGYGWTKRDVFLSHGLIVGISDADGSISTATLPNDTIIYEAHGRPLTAGIIDMHSHAGVASLPSSRGNEDTNEGSSDITPYVRSIDGLNPLDHQLQVIKSGGVTTSLILPGSANNIGGEAFVVKHAVGPANGRNETSANDMLAAPDGEWRYMKMACGENPKRVYGRFGKQGPTSRLGESWEFRHAFETAAKVVRAQDDWCAAAAERGIGAMASYLPADIEWESLSAVLRGQVLVNTHCYTIPDLEAYVDHTNEFKFAVRAFHHAHQTYLVPEILKRTWGGRAPASALFADNMYYKAESAVASVHAGKILYDSGLTTVYVSDNPVLNAQHVVFEAAKAYRYGLPYHAALASVTTAPAELLGLGERLGKIKIGYDADVVVWDSDPLSVGATPQQVWIDGDAQFADPVVLNKTFDGTIVPDEALGDIEEKVDTVKDVIFTGIASILHPGFDEVSASIDNPVNVVIQSGKITCVGTCRSALASASSETRQISVKNGYLTPSFTAFGSTLGLNAIDAEEDTDNGADESKVYARAVDGLELDNAKLHAAYGYGVTRAISAPKFRGQASHHGNSVGFLTGAKTTGNKDAIWGEDVSAHFTIAPGEGESGLKALSSVVGALRAKLLLAVGQVKNGTMPEYKLGGQAFMKEVVKGEFPLVFTAHSADAILALLRVKRDVEEEIKLVLDSKAKIKMAIIGGAEAPLVAKELARADVGVVLAPFLSYRTDWAQRRALTGAPLTNGTAVDALTAAGVKVAIGLEEDWVVRDLGLYAGISYANGEGKLSEKEALALVGSNIWDILGLKEDTAADEHFLVYEGSPLEIGGRVKAVAGGLVAVSVFG